MIMDRKYINDHEKSLTVTTKGVPMMLTDQEEITSWEGLPIDLEIRKALEVGNWVRVYFSAITDGKSDPEKHWASSYIKIISINGDWIEGIIDDPYWNGVNFDNGEYVWFQANHICEIPLQWEANHNLIHFMTEELRAHYKTMFEKILTDKELSDEERKENEAWKKRMGV
jgi:hypothetical protein